jgi:ankyrin repeat protein
MSVGRANDGHIRFAADQIATAIYHKDMEFMIKKHEHGEVVDEPDGFSLTPLMHACASGDERIVAFLLKVRSVTRAV